MANKFTKRSKCNIINHFVKYVDFMSTVLFWRDVEGDKELFSPYKKKIQQLLNGEYTNLNLEKLQNTGEFPLYSIRATDDERLLFTTFKGKLFLLDVVENHDYHKSRFLRNSNVLPAHMQKVAEQLKTNKKKFTLCEGVTDLDEQGAQNDFNLKGIEFHHQQLIHFTDEQENARTITTPAVGLGPAGSGKTSVALSMAQKHVHQEMNNNDDDLKPVLILSRSPFLVALTRAEWMNLVADPEMQKRVEFLTFEDLAKRKNPKIKLTKGYEEFTAWCKSKEIKLDYDLMRVWLEFRIASGYTAEQYAALGNKQSCTFVAEEKRATARKEIYDLFTRYVAYLKNTGLVDLELSYPEGNEEFALVLLDEAQDCTCDQLKKASSYAEGMNIVYFLGDHQILFDGKSRLSYLRNLYHSLKIPLTEQRLKGTFRCAQAVINVANRLIALKYHLVGGAADKGESHHMELASTANLGPGYIEWRSSAADLSDLLQQGIHLAVVTSPELIEEAKIKFGTPLVFTPAQIKGLEYERIVMWKPFASKVAMEANKLLSKQPFIAEHSGHRAKTGQSREEFLPFCDELTTGATRAKKQLIVVQDSTHDTEHLVNAVRPVFTQSASTSSTKVEYNVVNKVEDWQKEAVRQRNLGNTQQADDIEARFDTSSPSTSASSSSSTSSSLRFFSEPNPIAETPGSVTENSKDKAKSKSQKAKSAAPAKTTVSASTSSTTAVASRTLTEEQMLGLLDNILKQKQINIVGLVTLINANHDSSRLFLRCLVNHARFIKLPVQEILNCKNLNAVLKEGLTQIQTHFLGKLKNFVEAQIDKQILVGITPTMFATTWGWDKAIELFHKYGANINAKNKLGATALHVAVANQQVSTLKLLLKLGADIQAKDNTGATVAHAAIFENNRSRETFEILKILKENGLDLNIENHGGITPAAIATINGDVGALKSLKRLAVDFDQLDQSGYSQAHYAIFKKKFHVLSVLKEVKCNLNQRCRDNVNTLSTISRLELGELRITNEALTPIEAAVQLGYDEVVEKLVDLGVDPKQKNKLDNNLAHVAAGFGWPKILKYLHSIGVNLSERCSIGSTPAHLAADTDKVESLIVLKELGEPLDAVNQYGITPFMSAIWFNSQKCVDFFVKDNPDYIRIPLVFSRASLNSIPDALINKKQLHILEIKLNEQGKTEDKVSVLPHELAQLLGYGVLSVMLQLSESEIVRRSTKMFGPGT